MRKLPAVLLGGFLFLFLILLENTFGSDLPQGQVPPNVAFGVGEKLYYTLFYGPIRAGSGFMAVKDTVLIDDYLCYHIESVTRSNKLFSLFFEVKDRIESFIDIEGMFPRKFRKELHEGKFKEIYAVTFLPERGIAISGKDTIRTPSFVQDALSSFYFLRTCKLKPGESISFNCYSKGKVYPFKARVLRRERIKVRAGDFNCLVVQPLSETPGLFFKAKGKLTLWFTDDQLKIPVLMKTKLWIGSLRAELTRYYPKGY